MDHKASHKGHQKSLQKGSQKGTKEIFMRRGRPRKSYIPQRNLDLFLEQGKDPSQPLDGESVPNTAIQKQKKEANRAFSSVVLTPLVNRSKDPLLSKTTPKTPPKTKNKEPTQAKKPQTKSPKRFKTKEPYSPFIVLETKSFSSPRLVLFNIAPWSSHMRSMPNDYARSALFTVRNKRIARVARQGFPIFHVNDDVHITYTGIELRAEDDELVWQQVLEYAKHVPVGDPITFTFHRLCTDLGWSINGQYYKRAEECLSRLQASAMQFSSKRLGRIESISLIRRFRLIDHATRHSVCQVEIDAEMVLLFAGGNYTRFVWEKYRKLSPTARRMFDYFASHKKPFPIKLETFRLMCGSDSTRPSKWKEQVGHACVELCASGLVEKVFIEKNMVHCLR